MLAYELFLKNKSYEGEYGKPTPIKKLFVKRSNGNFEVEVDETSLEEYGMSSTEPGFQSLFSMPNKTLKNVNLPFRETGPNSPKPYIIFKGSYKKQNKKQKLTISLTGSKPKKGNNKTNFNFTYSFKDEKIEPQKNDEKLFLNLNNKNYYIAEKTLFDAYVDSGIITKDSFISKTLFEAVCNKFLEFFINKLKNSNQNPNVKFNFELVVLPENLPVTFKEETKEEENSGIEFIDSFGVKSTDYPIKPTQTAKFLSFDDPSFAINCANQKKFYSNLGIGVNSFEKINLPVENNFKISGLDWYFFNLINDNNFKDKKIGFYGQLLENYKELKKNTKRFPSLAAMKVLCFKKNQAKLELLLDENLTFKTLEEMFPQREAPKMVLEVLIESSNDKKVIIWNKYIKGIRSFIRRTPLEKEFLLQYFSRRLREKIIDWLKPINQKEAISFLKKSEFCFVLLTQENRGDFKMNEDEKYAYKIGKIVGKYMNFKKKAKEESNAISDLLTYSTYDREKLRFAFKRVSIGVSLSKAEEEELNGIRSFIKNELPSNEISDENASKDYSYFFYKGFFEALEEKVI